MKTAGWQTGLLAAAAAALLAAAWLYSRRLEAELARLWEIEQLESIPTLTE